MMRALPIVTLLLIAITQPVSAVEAPEGPASSGPMGVDQTRMRLTGVSLGSAQALLWDGEAGEYVLRRLGDDIAGWRIVAIEEDHLLLEQGETRAEMGISPPPQKRTLSRKSRRAPAKLTFAAEEGDHVAQSAPPAPPASALEAPAVPVPAPPPAAEPAAPAPASAPPIASVLPAMIVPRAHFLRDLDLLPAQAAEISIIPHPGGGYRLLAMPQASVPARLGLRPGDVVLRIDGRPINAPEDGAQAAAWLRLTDRFTIDILRDGRQLTLRYVLQQ